MTSRLSTNRATCVGHNLITSSIVPTVCYKALYLNFKFTSNQNDWMAVVFVVAAGTVVIIIITTTIVVVIVIIIIIIMITMRKLTIIIETAHV